MHDQTVTEFLVAVHGDDELLDEVSAAVRGQGATEAAGALAQIAASRGYPITEQEAMAALAVMVAEGRRALNEAELDLVAAGVDGPAADQQYFRLKLRQMETAGDGMVDYFDDLWDKGKDLFS